MAIQIINVGSYANDGTGDDLRSAFEKVNANFAELDSEAAINDGFNLGSGAGIFAQKNSAKLEFKSLTSTDNSVTITNDSTTINLKSTPNIIEDTTPQLGGNLDLNNHYVYGGDVQTTIYGYDVPALAGMMDVLFSSNQMDLDMGTLTSPSTGNIDFNGTGNINFSDSAANQTNLDFGIF